MLDEEKARLHAELEGLQAELDERKKNLPAHSIRPPQLLRIEGLEERAAEIARELGAGE